MKTIAILITLFVSALSLHSEQEKLGQEVPQKTIATDIGDWIKGVSYVEAVVYDYRKSEDAFLVEKGVVHKGVVGPLTKRLTGEKLRELVELITGEHRPSRQAKCYEPHHGFIFYNADKKIIGHVEICFKCGNYHSIPFKGLPRNWDLVGLRKLCSGLGFPVHKIPEEWDQYFLDSADQPATATKSKVEGEEKLKTESEGRSQ